MVVNRSYIVASALGLAIVGWFVFNGGDDNPDIYVTPSSADSRRSVPSVVVRDVVTQPRPLTVDVYGRTAPNRSVEVKARTAGSVVATPLAEGQRVEVGTVVCRQDVDARRAVMDQAAAAVAQAEADLRATRTLVERDFRSPVQLSADQAALDAARAQLRQAEVELGNIVMRAPFAGVFDAQLAEIGDYLAPGQPCGRIVELDPMLVEFELTETQVGKVRVGQTVEVGLASGESLQGKIRFVEAAANTATRTFRVEATLPNRDRALKAGVTAQTRLQLDEVEAARVPASTLTLSEAGDMGVRYVDLDDRVRFAGVRIVDETPEGVWIAGLPPSARVIVKGQDFVAEGSEVRSRAEDASDQLRGSLASSGTRTEIRSGSD